MASLVILDPKVNPNPKGHSWHELVMRFCKLPGRKACKRTAPAREACDWVALVCLAPLNDHEPKRIAPVLVVASVDCTSVPASAP
eukprot:1161084-Pelagomonas_calceolata.AAC.6